MAVAIAALVLTIVFKPATLVCGVICLALGLALMVRGAVLYVRTSRLVIHRYYPAVFACLLSVLGVALASSLGLYFHGATFDAISPMKCAAFPRPGAEVILGGDELKLSSGSLGTISFYVGEDLAVAYAHDISQNRLDANNLAHIVEEDERPVSVIANDVAGVVLKGVSRPAGGLLIMLGGTADITIGGTAQVLPLGEGPVEALVSEIGQKSGLMHISLQAEHFSERARPR